ACHAARLRRHVITSSTQDVGPMLDLQEGHVFVGLTYPHLIGLGICRASRSGDLHTGLIRGWNRAPMDNVDLHQTCQQKSGQTMANQGQSADRGLEGLTAAAKSAANAEGAKKG